MESTKGTFETNLILLFRTNHIENVLQTLMEYDTKKVLRSENDLNANEKSAVEELFNILMGHYIAALSNFLQAQFDPAELSIFLQKIESSCFHN